jgi:Ca2+-binding EF-hand superfamily protein
MSRKLMLAILTALPLAGGTICATAQDASSTAAAPARPSFFQHMLSKMDANGDGKISQDEYLAAASARFDKLDTAHTGKLTAEEIAASPAAMRRGRKMAQSMLERLDTAGNGYVTRDEFLAAAKTRFAKLDANGDGFIDPSEATGRRWARMRSNTGN